MQFMSRQTLKHLEATIQNSYSLPIFKGYKAINKTGIEKLIDELYANLPDDVKRAREYLHSRNYEMKSIKKENSVYDFLQRLEVTLDEAIPILEFGHIVILNIREIETLLNKIENTFPEEILKAEILSRQ